MKNALAIGGMLALLASAYVVVRAFEETGPALILGRPLRSNDRVYLLTSQSHSRISFSSRPTRGTRALTEYYVDLWAFDANTAAPMWRKRLYNDDEPPAQGWRLLGAQGRTLWAFGHGGLTALSLDDGSVLADPAGIEQRNPALKAMLPQDERYYLFDSRGLNFTAADGRGVWMDSNLNAHPTALAVSGPAIEPAYWAPLSPSAWCQRGLSVGGTRWLGLLSEAETTQLTGVGLSRGLDLETRRRLWSARPTIAGEGYRRYHTYTDLQPMGPEFLGPCLLSDHRSVGPNQVLWQRNPDSVLVMHRDRLGEEGKMRLTRVAGPDGRVVWEAHLPLSVPQSLMPGERGIALTGVEYQPPDEPGPRDPLHTATHLLVAVDLTTGRVGAHDFSRTDRHIAAK